MSMMFLSLMLNSRTSKSFFAIFGFFFEKRSVFHEKYFFHKIYLWAFGKQKKLKTIVNSASKQKLKITFYLHCDS